MPREIKKRGGEKVDSSIHEAAAKVKANKRKKMSMLEAAGKNYNQHDAMLDELDNANDPMKDLFE